MLDIVTLCLKFSHASGRRDRPRCIESDTDSNPVLSKENNTCVYERVLSLGGLALPCTTDAKECLSECKSLKFFEELLGLGFGFGCDETAKVKCNWYSDLVGLVWNITTEITNEIPIPDIRIGGSGDNQKWYVWPHSKFAGNREGFHYGICGDYDEDAYDDDMYEGHDLPHEIKAIGDNLDIRV
ncbi:hypothetical protein Tco_1059788 [Tanacetum coccineum]